MSERGSFTTEYIYCDKCLEAVKSVLISDEKYLKGIQIPMWGGGDGSLPIIAGKIGGMSSGEEIWSFKYEEQPEIEKNICHPVRIAILAENGEEIIYLTPSLKEVEE